MDKSVYTKKLATTELILEKKTVIATVYSTAEGKLGCLEVRYRNNRLRRDAYFGYDKNSVFNKKSITSVVLNLETGAAMLGWEQYI